MQKCLVSSNKTRPLASTKKVTVDWTATKTFTLLVVPSLKQFTAGTKHHLLLSSSDRTPPISVDRLLQLPTGWIALHNRLKTKILMFVRWNTPIRTKEMGRLPLLQDRLEVNLIHRGKLQPKRDLNSLFPDKLKFLWGLLLQNHYLIEHNSPSESRKWSPLSWSLKKGSNGSTGKVWRVFNRLQNVCTGNICTESLRSAIMAFSVTLA